MKDQSCLVLVDCIRINGISQDFSRRLRLLRRHLKRCPGCSNFNDCDVLRGYRSAIDEAVAEVLTDYRKLD